MMNVDGKYESVWEQHMGNRLKLITWKKYGVQLGKAHNRDIHRSDEVLRIHAAKA